MSEIVVTVPEMFVPVVDRLVAMTQAGSREAWVANVVRGLVIEFQIGQEQQGRAQELLSQWPVLPIAGASR